MENLMEAILHIMKIAWLKCKIFKNGIIDGDGFIIMIMEN